MRKNCRCQIRTNGHVCPTATLKFRNESVVSVVGFESRRLHEHGGRGFAQFIRQVLILEFRGRRWNHRAVRSVDVPDRRIRGRHPLDRLFQGTRVRYEPLVLGELKRVELRATWERHALKWRQRETDHPELRLFSARRVLHVKLEANVGGRKLL